MNLGALKKFVAEGAENCRVLVIGDAMLDKYYFGEVTRISPEAPVPINRVTKIKEILGEPAEKIPREFGKYQCRVIEL